MKAGSPVAITASVQNALPATGSVRGELLLPLAKRLYWRVLICARMCIEDIAGTLKDFLDDRRLGIDTSFDNVPITQGTLNDAENYEPTRYSALEFIVDYLQLNTNDVFVDYGCGKARAVCVVARRTLKKVVGVEYDERVAGIARANVAALRGKMTETEIVISDAIHFDPDAGTVFFLYNPFGIKSFEKVLNNLRESHAKHPRKIRIVYINDRYKGLMESQSWLKLETTFKHINQTASIWRSVKPIRNDRSSKKFDPNTYFFKAVME